jgi:hypothetical protein
MQSGKAKSPGKLIAIIAGAVAVIAIAVYCLLPSKDIADQFKDKPESVAEETAAESEEEEILPEPDLVVIADRDGLKVGEKRVDDLALQQLVTEKVKTVRVNLADDTDALTLDVVSLALARAGRFSFQLADADGKHATEILIPKPSAKEKSYRGPYIELQQVRIKLLYYSPDGKPRYKGSDGRVILKVRARIFHKNNDISALMDWDALKEYLAKKKKEYRPPSAYPMKTLPVIIDARKYVPTTYVEKVVELLVGLGIRDISFAAPEIPY